MSATILPAPMLAYADNTDFFRQSSCVGVWREDPGAPLIGPHFGGPTPRLLYSGLRISNDCVRSSDNFFVWLAAHLHKKHAIVSLREVGTAKAVAALLGMAAILAQPMAQAVRLAIAAAFLLIFGDATILAYFNTLYNDASSIISGALLCALLAAFAGAQRQPSWRACLLGVLLLLWLGTSKQQFGPLAALLGALLALTIYLPWRGIHMPWRGIHMPWRGLARPATLLAAGVIAPLLFMALNADPKGVVAYVAPGNKEDAILATILPLAPDKPAALTTLGLPQTCLQALGQTGYDAQHSNINRCPEVDAISRLRLLPLFYAQPATFLRPMWLALTQSRTLIDVLPHDEQPQKPIPPRLRLLLATSLSTGLMALPPWTFALWLRNILLAGLACLPPLLLSLGRPQGGARHQLRAALACCAGGGLVGFYAMVSAVFGDGFVELARHSVLDFCGLVFVLIGFALMLYVAAVTLTKVKEGSASF